MNTQYGDPAVANYVKKDKKSGRSNLLKGYTVGSRAPTTAESLRENFGRCFFSYAQLLWSACRSSEVYYGT